MVIEPATIPKLFARNRKLYADSVALREKDLGIWQRTTWQEYWDHVCYFALGLRQMGLERGDKVSILGDNCREWLYADLAAQCSSAVTVGIYPTDVAGQVKYILENSESSFVIARDQEQVDKIVEVKDQLPRLKKRHCRGYERSSKVSRPYDNELPRSGKSWTRAPPEAASPV